MKKQTQAFKQIDWSWTLNYAINEVANGARALNHQIGRETNAEKQNLYAIRLKTIYDVLRADLNNNRLKLVLPNRTSVGPIRSMSHELTAMVKDPLYNDNISQQSYRDLSIEDQRVFYEIVKKTHVEHTLQTPIEDPCLTLKAEFDTLRGEISLGNNNPDMLRELYRLAADMFEQKLLSNKEFWSIIGALV
ncbi:unnamed protein product [Phytophthora fragariaefolia]|uniref:Unnamed protein product n=1 Tax=Phytophthora fragariaefolia TaxID=1490495 RepID=A0A9W6X6M1_9STRA|nr:unnamed protein product [Phytophthora fragariaefolia]